MKGLLQSAQRTYRWLRLTIAQVIAPIPVPKISRNLVEPIPDDREE